MATGKLSGAGTAVPNPGCVRTSFIASLKMMKVAMVSLGAIDPTPSK